jgi:hypothetical protein
VEVLEINTPENSNTATTPAPDTIEILRILILRASRLMSSDLHGTAQSDGGWRVWVACAIKDRIPTQDLPCQVLGGLG